MEISFASSRLQKTCNSEKQMRKEYGPKMVSILQRRLADLAAAENLEVMRALPGRCHELRGDLKGHLAVDLEQPNRLVFRPLGDDIRNKDTTLNWQKVEAVEIVAIGDYH